MNAPGSITVAMMLEPDKYGLTVCKHCNGYGSSLKESARTCTQCGGSGLVKKQEVLSVQI
jgi:DnaJ-class molecular chaperone